MTLTRRGFMQSILALAAAPAIVRAQSIMRVAPLIVPASSGLAFAPILIRELVGWDCPRIDVTSFLDTAKQYAYGLLSGPIYEDRVYTGGIEALKRDYHLEDISKFDGAPRRVIVRPRVKIRDIRMAA